jgi:membrane associated rhomboid family serine protease
MYPRVHVHLFVILGFYVNTIAVPAIFMLGYWFLLQLVSGTMAAGNPGGGVAFWAHVGGFVAGVVLSFVFRDRAMLARHPYHGWNIRSPTQNWRRVRR